MFNVWSSLKLFLYYSYEHNRMNEILLWLIYCWPHFSTSYDRDRRTSRICCGGMFQKQQICDSNKNNFCQRFIILRNNNISDTKTLFECGLSGQEKLVACFKQGKMDNSNRYNVGWVVVPTGWLIEHIYLLKFRYFKTI